MQRKYEFIFEQRIPHDGIFIFMIRIDSINDLSPDEVRVSERCLSRVHGIVEISPD
jgi:hypothetical protein